MSCNGCRILRKGCNDNCILRQSLLAIDSPQAQANATLFVAKFFGRAGLLSFLSSVAQSQRPALFQSLLFEACGRTVNPVNGAVGLLTTGNWHVCQSAVETVLRGGVLQPLPKPEEASQPNNNINDLYTSRDLNTRKQFDIDQEMTNQLDLGLVAGRKWRSDKRRLASPPSDESETTTLDSEFDLNTIVIDTQLDLGQAGGRKWRRRLASPPSDESETTTLDSRHDLHQNCDGHETKLLRFI